MRFGWSVYSACPFFFSFFSPSSPLPPLPSLLCLPSLLHPNALFAWGVDTPGVARTFYYTDEASCLLTDTRPKIDTQRFQVAAVIGTSVPGLPVRDCTESYNSSVPRCAKVSTVDVMNKTIFEHLYLVQGLGTLFLRVKSPYVLTPPPLIDKRFLDFRAIFSISRKSRNSCKRVCVRV